MLDFAKEAIENCPTELERYLEIRKKIKKYNNESDKEQWINYLKFTDKERIDWIKLKEIVKFDETRYRTY